MCGFIDFRQHRTKLVRRLRRQVFRQIVQARRRRADARQGELVQYDGKYASKMRAKRGLCAVLPLSDYPVDRRRNRFRP